MGRLKPALLPASRAVIVPVDSQVRQRHGEPQGVQQHLRRRSHRAAGESENGRGSCEEQQQTQGDAKSSEGLASPRSGAETPRHLPPCQVSMDVSTARVASTPGGLSGVAVAARAALVSAYGGPQDMCLGPFAQATRVRVASVVYNTSQVGARGGDNKRSSYGGERLFILCPSLHLKSHLPCDPLLHPLRPQVMTRDQCLSLAYLVALPPILVRGSDLPSREPCPRRLSLTCRSAISEVV